MKNSFQIKLYLSIFFFLTSLLYLQAQTNKTAYVTIKEIMADPPIEGFRPDNGMFSPDGEFVSYLWKDVDNNGSNNLWIFKKGEEKPTILVNEIIGNYNWTNDSKNILYSSEGDIHKIDVFSKETENLTNTGKIPQRFFLSSDESMIAYTDKEGIWIYDFRERINHKVFDKTGFNIQWSSDNNYIGFLFDKNLYSVNLKTKELNKHTEHKPYPGSPLYFDGVIEFKWAPGKNYLAYTRVIPSVKKRDIMVPDYLTEFVTTIPGRNDFAGDSLEINELGLIDFNSGQTQIINHTKNGYPSNGIILRMEWAPDGNTLAIEKLDNLRSRSILLARPNNSEAKVLFSEEDPKWVSYSNSQLAWTYNSGLVLFNSDKDGFNHIYKYDLETKKLEQVTTGNYEVGVNENHDSKETIFKVLHTKQALIYHSNKKTPSEIQMYYKDLITGEEYCLNPVEGCSRGIIISKNDDQVLFQQFKSGVPFDFFTVDINQKAKLTQVSNTLSNKFLSIDWVKPQFISYPNISDGKMVHAKMFLPPNFSSKEKYPLLLFFHGGLSVQNAVKSWTLYKREYMFHHYMSQKGYIILDIDFRGTSGYGREFSQDIYQQVGYGKDLEDVISGIEYLKNLGYIDSERVGCYGGSGGGFLTLMGLSLKPEYFSCGAALRSLTDWKKYSAFLSTRILGELNKYPEVYEKCSPITYADKLKRPLLLIHGLKDTNAFAQESITYAEKLIQNGIDFEFMLYPSEDHGFTDPDCWFDEYRRIARFMDKYLLNQ